MAVPTSEDKAAYHRRSQRVRMRIRVVVRFQRKDTPVERTHSIVVNAHGGLILLATPVSLDQFIVLENPKTKQEMLCRVTKLGPSFMGKAQVAVEFIKPGPGFWGMEAPPEDWEGDNLARGPRKPPSFIDRC
jgi:hypothetical protein